MASKKTKKSTQLLSFTVDDKDIRKNLKRFAEGLGKDVAEYVRLSGTAEQIFSNVENRLDLLVPPGSPRIKTLKEAMRKNKKVGFLRSGRSKARRVYLRLVKVGTMDAETKISVLDRKFPPRHRAPFNKPPNPFKKIGSISSRKPQNALWRLLEYKTKTSYQIPKYESGPVHYTTARDGYSKWHVHDSVMWRGNLVGSFYAYYLLNAQRMVYKEDKRVFEKAIVKGIDYMILTKTRFHR